MKAMTMKIEHYKTRRPSRLMSWIRKNRTYLLLQTICLALTPGLMHVMMLCRGYYAVGSEGFLIIAPTIYKLVKWALSYDEYEE